MSRYSTRPLTSAGIKIKTALVKKNMTQRELAAEIGIKENSLIEIMRGSRPIDSIKERAEQILGVSL